MLLRQVIYFQAVVETGSFTNAAEKNHISQSAISQQIQSLEEELGVALLTRKNRSFDVTEAGKYFYKQTINIIADLDKVCKDTQAIANEQIAKLSIGYLQSYGGSEIQEAIARFASLYPDVSLSVKTGSHEDLYKGLLSEELDLVFSDQRRAFADGYNNLILTESATYVEIATFNPLSHGDKLDIDDLKNVSCILVASKGQNDIEEAYYRDIIGFESDFVFASTVQEARMLVVANRGVMPVEGGLGDNYFGSTLKRLPLFKKGHQLKRRYCAFWKVDNSGYYVETMAELLTDIFQYKEN